ncbi:unnamed protein product, partial [Rotaria sp. Silwood2]
FDLEQASSSPTTNDNDSQLHLDCFYKICN